MATSLTSPFHEAKQKNNSLPLQKKLLQDVLECIIQLKADFFDNHQPITDDNVVLQRFCAKFEYLMQAGMKEKSSLLGRKKDYWDYFCECLWSAKGSNDGIRYVKSLAEHKTSLGRGRAFIRFCLVHQRLADTLQQCVVHDKTKDWFVPSSVFMNRKDCESIINSLYDLNSLHFDLSPKGYDLDTAWPSFSNRKPGPGGTWSVPISRRSSVTSMDAVSQISVSVDVTEVDRLTRDLEVAQNTKSELIGQIDALQQEKEQASQSAWATQGELQAIQQHLTQLQSQHAALQERYKELDITHMKLKLEAEHTEKHLHDQIKILNEKFREEEVKRVKQLELEEQIWKKEVKEEGDRRKREIDKLQKELEMKMKELEVEKERVNDQELALKLFMTDFNIAFDSEDIKNSLARFAHHLKTMQQELRDIHSEKTSMQSLIQGEQSEREKQVSHLEGCLLELERALKESQEVQVTLHDRVTVCDLELKAQQDSNENLRSRESNLQVELENRESEMRKLQGEVIEAGSRNAKLEQKINDWVKEKDGLYGNIQELEKENARLKFELQNKETDLDFSASDRQEKEQKLQELCRNIEEYTSQKKDKEEELQRLKVAFEEKKEEVILLKQSSEGKTLEVEELIKNKDQALTVIRSELTDMAHKWETVRKEAEDLRNKLSVSESQIADMNKQESVMEEKVVFQEVALNELKTEVQNKDAVVMEIQAQNCELQDVLTSVRENLRLVMSQAEKMNADLQRGESEREALRTEVKLLQVEKESLKITMDSEKTRVVGLLKASEGMKALEGEKEERISDLVAEISKLRNEKEEMVLSLEEKIQSLTSDINEKNMEISIMRSEIENLKTILDNEKSSMAEVVDSSESKFQKLSNEKEESELKLEEKIRNLQSDLAEKVKAWEIKSLEYETTVEDLNKKLKNLTASAEQAASVNEMLSEVATLREERDQLLAQAKITLDDLQQIKSEVAEKTQKLEVVTNEKDSLSLEFTAVHEELSRVGSEKDVLQREVIALKNSLKVAEDEAQEKLSQKRGVELELEDLKGQLSIVLSENEELGKQLEGYQSQTAFSTKVLEEHLIEMRDAMDCLMAEKMELQEKCETAQKEKDGLMQTVEYMKKEKDDLHSHIGSLKAETESSETREVARLKEELRIEKEKHVSAVESLEAELSALQFQLSAERMMKNDELQAREGRSEDVLKMTVLDLEFKIEQLEKDLESRQKSKDAEHTQVQELQKQLLGKQEECDMMENQFRQVESRLKEETTRREKIESDFTLLRHSYSKDMEDKELEIKNLQSDNEQIKKKLIKLIKDKDTLWHKTDQLVTEQKRIIENRWQDSALVTNCLDCKTEFSLFVRKHHCRICGRIFCWSCSDFWIDSPHSRKKVRTCKSCFDHNNSLGTSLQSTSMIDVESDDDDDNDDDDDIAVDGDEGKEEKTNMNSKSSRNTATVPSSHNQTDEGKMRQSGDEADRRLVSEPASSGSEGDITDDSLFQIIDQEAVMRSISTYSSQVPAAAMPPNMTSSMMLLADELKSGEVNKQNEVWIKPGKTFIVPIDIERESTVLHWEFTSQPKDIVFSVNYRVSEATAVTEAEEIVAPCKCDSHRQTVRGELTAKQKGIYTLVFDNTYSKVTSKKVHYSLEYKKQT